MNRCFIALFVSLVGLVTSAAQQTKTNVVCFVRFADEDETVFTNTPEHYASLFNGEGEGVNSVYSYFKWVSYGNLDWKTSFFPSQAGSTIVVSYQDKLVRNALRPKSDSNPDGYSGGDLGGSLAEQGLIQRACEYLTSVLSDDDITFLTIDNLTVVFSGNSERYSRDGILWPHQDMMRWKQASIKGKPVYRYLIVFDAGNGYSQGKPKAINTGVLCHEMSHALGTYDLYTSDSFSPVGIWDLMSNNQTVPQGMTAYMRSRYGGWIPDIPTITSDGIYTLNPVGSDTPDNVAYKIVPDATRGEYFMLEYRRNIGTFESSLPASGLLCYRINQGVSSNLQTPYEVYIFRPGGTAQNNGNVEKAALSSDLGNTSLNVSSSLSAVYYSNGDAVPFAITEVGHAGETISFRVTLDGSGVEGVEDGYMKPYYNSAGGILVAPEDARVEVYSLNGTLCMKGRDISSLPSGAYLVRVFANGTSTTLKIVK